jgi:hypothetical protein
VESAAQVRRAGAWAEPRVKIAIVGNYGLQQFPLLSVGGVEAAVESLAWGMHRAGADFLCVVPRRGPRFLPFVRRDRRADYPFEIVETRHGPVGPSRRRAGVISQEAARILASEKPDVIWCQGHWSYPAFLDLGVPIISSFQDSHEKRPGWMMRLRRSINILKVEEYGLKLFLKKPGGNIWLFVKEMTIGLIH